MVNARIARGALGAAAAGVVVCNVRRWKVTNLALQNILYVAEAVYLLKFGDAEAPLIGEDFYAWPLGPVLPDLYERVKDSGSADILPSGGFNWELTPHENPTSEQWKRCAFLENLADVLRYYSTFSLVRQTHSDGGAWAHASAGSWPWELRRLQRVIGKADILTREREEAFYQDLVDKPLWP